MQILNVPKLAKKLYLKQFFNHKAWTFEGIILDNAEIRELIEKALLSSDEFKYKELIAYQVSGDCMNEVFELSGQNAYAADYNFIVVPEIYNYGLKKWFNEHGIKVRWFSDIVHSNAIKQTALELGGEPDFE